MHGQPDQAPACLSEIVIEYPVPYADGAGGGLPSATSGQTQGRSLLIVVRLRQVERSPVPVDHEQNWRKQQEIGDEREEYRHGHQQAERPADFKPRGCKNKKAQTQHCRRCP